MCVDSSAKLCTLLGGKNENIRAWFAQAIQCRDDFEEVISVGTAHTDDKSVHS